jgi:hypothetical protein
MLDHNCLVAIGFQSFTGRYVGTSQTVPPIHELESISDRSISASFMVLAHISITSCVTTKEELSKSAQFKLAKCYLLYQANMRIPCMFNPLLDFLSSLLARGFYHISTNSPNLL